MGCVQTKPLLYSPPRGLNRLKQEHGYVVKGRPMSQNQLGKDSGGLFQPDLNNGSVGVAVGDGDGDDRGDGRFLSREGEKEGDVGGNVSKRISSSSQVGSDELVDGWPKWLVDNIPREALIGLVPKSADSYDKLDKIGQGTYSNVYKARDRDTGKIVALKKVRFDTSESESVKFMAREIMVLQKLNHPNIIKLEGLATSRMQYSLYLVFDFMQSDLARIVSRPDMKLTEPQVKSYMQQLLSGLQHCHEKGILHRDIKGSNLLIDKSGMLKIADFGLANYFHPNQKRPLTSRVVTLWYRAPELLLGATDYGVGIDLWSAGCLLAEMFSGRPIMPGRTEVEQLHRIFKLCGSPSEDYWKKLKLSTSFRLPQPYKPNLLETFKDFPSSSLNLLAMLLALDPAYRGSASSALQKEFFNTSPLACDLSGLPVIYKGEDESTQTNGRIRSKKAKNLSRTHSKDHRRKHSDIERSKGDSGSSKEEQEKNAEPNFHSQELGSTTGSTSSGVKPSRHEESTPPPDSTSSRVKPSGHEESLSSSPYQVLHSRRKRSPRTDCHPNASKNIKNLPPLPSSKSTTNIQEDGDNMYRLSLNLRTVSTVDFRHLDQAKMPKLSAYDDYEI